MSRLDAIYEALALTVSKYNALPSKEVFKEQVKTIELEMIGEDEHIHHFSFHGRWDTRDELRSELRKKVEEQ